jgi:hypothetical protein
LLFVYFCERGIHIECSGCCYLIGWEFFFKFFPDFV